MDAHHSSRLLLSWLECEVAVAPDASVKLGRGHDNDLHVDLPYASRLHAQIRRDKQYFVLTDCSTNGTYVQSEDLKVTHVHRNQVRLWGNGWLSLGHSMGDGHAIRFRHD